MKSIEMKITEKKLRLLVVIFVFSLTALHLGTEIASKYLIGGIAAGIVGIIVTLIWNRISVK